MNFENSNFHWDGLYLRYGKDRRFVARFKYNKGRRTAFQRLLVANCTVEDYFEKLEAGTPPLLIVSEVARFLAIHPDLELAE